MNPMKTTAGGGAYPWRPDRTDAELRALAAARRPKVVRLWLPMTPLFVVLAPFALVTAPLIMLYPPARGVSPWRTVWTLGATLLSMGGTEVDVRSRRALIRIRIF